ncbi:hypothetical protein QEH59_03240, partial [Coraliomargarita sp. SDUM461004]
MIGLLFVGARLVTPVVLLFLDCIRLMRFGLGSAVFTSEAPAMLVCVKNVEAVSWFLHIKVWFL